MTNGLNWETRRNVVVPQQRALAIFCDEDGYVKIAAQAHWDEEADVVIEIDPLQAVRVANAILRAAGFKHIYLCRKAGGGYVQISVPDPLPPKRAEEARHAREVPRPRDATSAERQRRYRERQKEKLNGAAGAHDQ